MWQDHSTPQEVRIEIVPLIDVIFCILVFFMLAAVGVARQQAINTNLPKASTGTPQMRDMLVVSLDDFGQAYVEQQPVTRSQLDEQIKNYYQFNPNGLVALHASGNSSYNEVIQVLDQLRKIGGNRVALAVAPGDPKPAENFNFAPNNSNPYPNSNTLPYNIPSPSGSLTPQQPSFPYNPTPSTSLTPNSSGVPPAPNTPR
jgi:biopolymer transport protein ExbD